MLVVQTSFDFRQNESTEKLKVICARQDRVSTNGATANCSETGDKRLTAVPSE